MATFSVVFNSIVWFLIVVFTIYVWHGLLISKKGKYPPFVPATGEAKKIIVERVSEILRKSSKPLTVLDPGCGVGSLLMPLARRFPQHNFVGIEWSWPYYLAKLRGRKLKNMELVHGDMFEQSFSQADIIVCFLVEKLGCQFAEKILKEAKKNAVIFSVAFEMPFLSLMEKFEYKIWGIIKGAVYEYEIKKRDE